MTTMSFDEVFKQIHPIVVQAAPQGISLGHAKEIAEDVAYLISHGYALKDASVTSRDSGVRLPANSTGTGNPDNLCQKPKS